MSVERALSRLLYIRGHSIVDATVCPWTEHCRCYWVSVEGALSRLLCIRGNSIVDATV